MHEKVRSRVLQLDAPLLELRASDCNNRPQEQPFENGRISWDGRGQEEASSGVSRNFHAAMLCECCCASRSTSHCCCRNAWKAGVTRRAAAANRPSASHSAAYLGGNAAVIAQNQLEFYRDRRSHSMRSLVTVSRRSSVEQVPSATAAAATCRTLSVMNKFKH